MSDPSDQARVVRQWVEKADNDLKNAEHTLLLPDEECPYDTVCFHAQQCAEKYFKARLVEAGVEFPKIHDLAALLDLLLSIEPTWEQLREDLYSLTDCAVEVRYPGYFSEADEAEEAVEIAKKAVA